MPHWRTRPGVWLLCWLVACGVGLALAFPAGAQAPVAQGGQFQTTGFATRLTVHRGYVLVADSEWLTILKYVEP